MEGWGEILMEEFNIDRPKNLVSGQKTIKIIITELSTWKQLNVDLN